MAILLTYISLFIVAFLAASLLPAQSEVWFTALLVSKKYSITLLLLFATTGNVAGACFNWWLGKYVVKYRQKKWFPFNAAQLRNAQNTFNKYGSASLLLSWLPLVGDPLTFAAGILKVPFMPFFILVTAGKLGRYIILTAITLQVMA